MITQRHLLVSTDSCKNNSRHTKRECFGSVPCVCQCHMWSPWRVRCSERTAGWPWCDRLFRWCWPWCAVRPREVQTLPSVVEGEDRSSRAPQPSAAALDRDSTANWSPSSVERGIMGNITISVTLTLTFNPFRITFTCIPLSYWEKSSGKSIDSWEGKKHKNLIKCEVWMFFWCVWWWRSPSSVDWAHRCVQTPCSWVCRTSRIRWFPDWTDPLSTDTQTSVVTYTSHHMYMTKHTNICSSHLIIIRFSASFNFWTHVKSRSNHPGHVICTRNIKLFYK